MWGALATLLAIVAGAYSVHNLSGSILLAVLVGGVSGLLYLRYWIQGFWFDRWYVKRTHAHLKDKIVVVTGGTVGGLGFAAAELFASLEAKVVITVWHVSRALSLTNADRRA
jgi:hypothetical protein